MNSILGQGAVLVALASAVFGCVVGLVGGWRRDPRGTVWARRCTWVFAGAMVFANLVMIGALLSHDFSVRYVAQVGSRSVPAWLSVVSLWSSLEGSILFWGGILGGYLAAFAYAYRRADGTEAATGSGTFAGTMPHALGVSLGVAAFFALLLSAPADPFAAVSPVPPDGPGPNPLLQNHLLMIVHPPMLYLGYVGMTVPFAVAMAALLSGEFNKGWLKVLRRWTLVPWMFLTVGIILGGWWAYEVLGWGGYWAWDPVENASFLPWLAATGYLHATLVQERKGLLKVWTLSLVLVAFLLTILGTFMTRSGVFNSVHSFTQSAIGPAFLVFLAILTCLSMGLLAGRAHLLHTDARLEAVVSRETAFFVNNLLFVVFTFTVLLGTVFPLITEAVRGVQVSVGEPYFDRMAIPLGLMLVFLMGVGPVLPWGRPQLSVVVRDVGTPLAFGIVTAAVAAALGMRAPLVLLTLGLCAFAGIVTLREMWAPVGLRLRRRARGEIAGTAMQAVIAGVLGARRRFGGYVVHIAVLMVVIAIAVSQGYRQTAEQALKSGDTLTLGDMALTYHKTEAQEAPHRFAIVAQTELFHQGESVGTMTPALAFYPRQREPIGTPHVRTVGHEDVYASLVSFDREGGQVVVKLYRIPLVAWIWWALPVFVFGCLIALWPSRASRATAAASNKRAQA